MGLSADPLRASEIQVPSLQGSSNLHLPPPAVPLLTGTWPKGAGS